VLPKDLEVKPDGPDEPVPYQIIESIPEPAYELINNMPAKVKDELPKV